MGDIKKYVLALDQGTTSSRAILFDHSGNQISTCQKEFTQFFPQQGWVEHDPMEIWSSQENVMREAIKSVGTDEIAAIGIANQRETTIVWNASTGEPIYNAIVWQDRRTSEYCDSLKVDDISIKIRQKTGLIPDAYFSATKICWILKNVPGAAEMAEKGELRFGNVDSWLVWNLTKGKVHITDVTNASRTMLFNINTLEWDDDLLRLFGIPESMLPKVCSCSEIYGETEIDGKKIAIAGIAGDQQAALFGQLCLEPGSVKNTYGTGSFLLMNTGENPVISKNNLLTTIACQIDGKTTYAIEGSIFVTGSAVQWLRDGLGILEKSSDVEALACSVPDNGGVYFVPALTGLGAPWWDQYATGTIVGITRGITAAHIARATLEGIAFQVMDIVQAMEKDAGVSLKEIKVDGGACVNDTLMQFQADVISTTVIRPTVTETTALGVAYLAGLATGFWSSIEELKNNKGIDKKFEHRMPLEKLIKLRSEWHNAVNRTVSK